MTSQETQTDRLCGRTCLAKVKYALMEYHGESADINLVLKPTINLKTFETGVELPPLAYSYLERKKRKRSYVTFRFCPFCGGRLEE